MKKVFSIAFLVAGLIAAIGGCGDWVRFSSPVVVEQGRGRLVSYTVTRPENVAGIDTVYTVSVNAGTSTRGYQATRQARSLAEARETVRALVVECAWWQAQIDSLATASPK